VNTDAAGPALDAPGDADGPVFAEAWHAEVYALTASLIDGGLVTRAEWAEALGEAIRAAQAAGDADLGDTYYEHWLAALEGLCAAKGLALGPAVDQRAEDWREAYLHTPHGQPVELGGDAHPAG
jgi:nitrile hydratase accessory protein